MILETAAAIPGPFGLARLETTGFEPGSSIFQALILSSYLGYFCFILLCLSRFVLSARFFFFVRRAKYYETGLQRGAQRFPKLQ